MKDDLKVKKQAFHQSLQVLMFAYKGWLYSYGSVKHWFHMKLKQKMAVNCPIAHPTKKGGGISQRFSILQMTGLSQTYEWGGERDSKDSRILFVPEEMGRGKRESVSNPNCTRGSDTYVSLAKPHVRMEQRLRHSRKMMTVFCK